MRPEGRRDLDHDAVCRSDAHHLVVVAPPGTGKTFLAVRLAGEIGGTLPAHARVLLLTFSNQARVQLEIEAARQLPIGSRARVEVTNYHRFFWHAILAYRQALGLPMDVELVSRRRRHDALKRGAPVECASLGRQEALTECLAEHGFAEFRDNRTPPPHVLQPMLDVVRAEYRAGRLIFDDLGALFWELVNRFPTVDAAYRTRYPVVIADEHQDASALQDAVVRRLGSRRLVVFADPMQLIHGFRGASPERLERHVEDCSVRHTLSTPHRWNGKPDIGAWLLSVRARLEGGQASANRPGSLRIVTTLTAHGFNGVLNPAKIAVLNAFRHGCQRVAVLAWRNDDVARLRDYLSRSRLFPRHIGGSDDFEEAREVIEELPTIADGRELALRVINKIASLVPTLSAAQRHQVERRLERTGVNRKGCTQQVAALLDAIEPVYGLGPAYFFRAAWDGLRACTAAGYHLPRSDAARALRETAEESVSGLELGHVLQKYAARIASATHAAPRLGHGVFVMTAHQAKGKEFDAVVLCHATVRDFPDSAEGRRLFYVAITRATSEWVIIAPAGQATPLIQLL